MACLPQKDDQRQPLFQRSFQTGARTPNYAPLIRILRDQTRGHTTGPRRLPRRASPADYGHSASRSGKDRAVDGKISRYVDFWNPLVAAESLNATDGLYAAFDK
jgi:hypothetical protein